MQFGCEMLRLASRLRGYRTDCTALISLISHKNNTAIRRPDAERHTRDRPGSGGQDPEHRGNRRDQAETPERLPEE